ncbi:MAG TPA: alpha/beta hydrolase-fold protein, partial [Minicystis sp.]|nr:alpha/beta hydrolase-fold protein [Minicystis sp.]
VVAVHTRERRLETLSPSRDARYGGGEGPRYLDFLVDRLKPAVDRAYRTLPEGAHTGLLGASMGGLFSFFAAWRRSDVFGKAACLSGSFWWDDRFMVRDVRAGGCPVPRPLLYIDSGAAKAEFDEDANRRDGYHHMVAMRNALVGHCYEPGVHVHALAFAGAAHENAAWAARLATPLQLLFPRESPGAEPPG